MAFYQDFRLGILGGGQLGRMLIQAATDLNIDIHILDPDPAAPCHAIAHHFTQGDLLDFDTVVAFGQQCDVITIEIEKVNTEALKALQRAGKKVYPDPAAIQLIQDKRTQKTFYKEQGIPTADFVLTDNRSHVAEFKHRLPAVHKLGKGGYDGKGVQVLQGPEDLAMAFDAPGVLEDMVPFEKEIAIIAVRNTKGEVSTFPAVEMVFHPTANLVEYLFAPATINENIAKEAAAIATQVIEAMDVVGLLAVEMFVTPEGKVLVNEVAPRPHNSGHQTIEGSLTSQYAQHLRAILGLPLGSTQLLAASAMVNILGAEGHNGMAIYQGLEEVMAIPGAFVHLYGKKLTKPFRKMGHVTLVDHDVEALKQKANQVKETLKVIA